MVNNIMKVKHVFLSKLTGKIWRKSRIGQYFSRWRINTIKGEMEEQMEEFENINIVLTERAFRDNMFRTKCRVEHMNVDKKIDQQTKLLISKEPTNNNNNQNTYNQPSDKFGQENDRRNFNHNEF